MNGLRVLIADDEPIIRMDLKEMLIEAGHEVVAEAADGQNALLLAKAYKPDIVIMDVKMPVMDGITAARELAAQKVAPVVLLTAYSDAEFIQKASEAQVFGYLVKPIQPTNLYPAISVALKNFTQQVNLEAKVADLEETLAKRKIIDRAKGILIKTKGISEADAHKLMQQMSMQRRASIKAIAEAIILNYEMDKG